MPPRFSRRGATRPTRPWLVIEQARDIETRPDRLTKRTVNSYYFLNSLLGLALGAHHGTEGVQDMKRVHVFLAFQHFSIAQRQHPNIVVVVDFVAGGLTSAFSLHHHDVAFADHP